jgi:hypothetical protein
VTTTIPVSSFLKDYDTEKRQKEYLSRFIATDFQILGNKIYINDRAENSIKLFSTEGEILDEISYRKEMLSIREFFVRSNEQILIRDARNRLLTIDENGNIDKVVENVSNFTELENDNLLLYFEDRSDHNIIIQDVHMQLSKPLEKEKGYYYVDDNYLWSLNFEGKYFDLPYYVRKQDYHNGTIAFDSTFANSCKNCFTFPEFIDSDLILASDEGKWKEFVFRPTSGRMYYLERPSGVEFLNNFEFVPLLRTGLLYYYKEDCSVLYAMGFTEEEIIIFSYDITETVN